MVRVPVTEPSSERLRPIEGRQIIPTTPAEFGGLQALALGGLGRSIGDAGDVLQLVAERKQNDRDATDALSSYNSFSDELRLALTELEERKGLNARGITTDATRLYDEIQVRHRKSMQTEAAALRFDALSQRKRDGTLNSIAAIEAREERSAKNNQSQLGIETEIQDAAKLADVSTTLFDLNASIVTKLANIDTFVRVRLEGQNEDVITAAISVAQSRLHKAVFDRLLLQNVPRAREYFDQHRDSINGLTTTAMEAKLKPAEKDFRASEIFQEVYDPTTPEADLIKAVRQKSKDPDVIKEATAQIRAQRASEIRDQAIARDRSYTALYSAIVEGELLIIDAKKTSEWAALSAAQQSSLRRIEDLRTKAMNLAKAAITASEIREQAFRDEGEFLKRDLREETGKITSEDLEELQNLQRRLSEGNKKKRSTFKTGARIVDDALRKVNILPKTGGRPATEMQRLRAAAFERRFLDEVEGFVERTGNEPDSREMIEIADRLLIEVTTRERAIFPDVTQRVFEFPQRLLEDFDPLDVDDAAFELQTRGLKVTAEGILLILAENRAKAAVPQPAGRERR